MAEDRARHRVRRRRRVDAPAPEPPPVPEPAPVPEPPPEPVAKAAQAPPRAPRRSDRSEHGLRGLVGAGPTQVSVSRAMRTRDAARPTAEDMRAAEEELVIVRRHYVPAEKLTGPGFASGSGTTGPSTQQGSADQAPDS